MSIRRTVLQSIGYIQEKVGKKQPVRAGIVTGSGLGGILDAMKVEHEIPYGDIPGFPVSTVEGHAGRLLFGTLAGTPVAVMNGRIHLYEGFAPQEVVHGIRVFFELGIDTVILTNAAGALNPQFETGRPMVITDHINFSGASCLTGDNHEEWGPRFPDMSRVYDRRLVIRAEEAALRLGIRLERGVYVQVPGPNLETPAETRAYRALGADAIGMSTALEAMAATHMNMRVLAFSCLTNKNLPDCMEQTSHEAVLAAAQGASSAMGQLLEEILKDFE
ncbi:purine-nucleoside phosphorylase [Salidesulfovibrio brasiliensis]